MSTATLPAAIRLKNIVFATDFSPAATAALPFATSLAQQFGGNLFAVHAKTPENYALPVTEVWPIANAQLENEANALKRDLRDNYPSLVTDVIVAEGGVSGVIEAVAEEKNADLIVLGTNGRRGIGKFLLGSVAEEVLRRAACPVLTVGPHVSTCHRNAAIFRKILYATDLAEGTPTAVAFALGFAHEHEARLVLLHVIEHPKVGDLVRPHELEAAALHRLDALTAGEPGLFLAPKTIVAHGAPAEKILEVAEKEGADLIVLGVRNANGFVRATHLSTAVAHQVISQATCPVLTVRHSVAREA